MNKPNLFLPYLDWHATLRQMSQRVQQYNDTLHRPEGARGPLAGVVRVKEVEAVLNIYRVSQERGHASGHSFYTTHSFINKRMEESKSERQIVNIVNKLSNPDLGLLTKGRGVWKFGKNKPAINCLELTLADGWLVERTAIVEPEKAEKTPHTLRDNLNQKHQSRQSQEPDLWAIIQAKHEKTKDEAS